MRPHIYPKFWGMRLEFGKYSLAIAAAEKGAPPSGRGEETAPRSNRDSKSPETEGQHEATDPPKFWGVGLGFRKYSLAIALLLPRNALHHRGEEKVASAGEDAYGGAACPVKQGRVEHGHTVTGRVVDG